MEKDKCKDREEEGITKHLERERPLLLSAKFCEDVAQQEKQGTHHLGQGQGQEKQVCLPGPHRLRGSTEEPLGGREPWDWTYLRQKKGWGQGANSSSCMPVRGQELPAPFDSHKLFYR